MDDVNKTKMSKQKKIILVILGIIFFIIGFVVGYKSTEKAEKDSSNEAKIALNENSEEVKYILAVLTSQFGQIATDDKIKEDDLSSDTKLYMLFSAYEFANEVVMCSEDDTLVPRSKLEDLLFEDHDFLDEYEGANNEFVEYYRYSLEDDTFALQNGTCDFSLSAPISILEYENAKVKDGYLVLEAKYAYLTFSNLKEDGDNAVALYNTHKGINDTKVTQENIEATDLDYELYDTYIITFDYETLKFISIEKK